MNFLRASATTGALRDPLHSYGRRALALGVTLAVAVASLVTVQGPTAQAAARAFESRFSKDLPGNIVFAANTQMTCSTATGALGASVCAGVQQGNGINNNHAMVFVDQDTDASTTSSSSSTLALPAGAVVQFAGLYWGGTTTAANRGTVKFKAPGGAYTTINATRLDDLGSPYQGFADVTSLVAAAGSGDYWTANIASTVGAGNYAGWSLVVMYSAPGEKTRNCTVFDGINSVSGGPVVIDVSGFRTPPVGPVNTKLGVIAYEGDRSTTGDALKLNGVTQSDAANGGTDFFNASISNSGTNVTTKNPNYLNQLGYDADILTVSNPSNSVIANGATSAQITMSTSGDVYYPGVVTFCTDLYAPQIVSTKSGRDTTPSTPLQPGDEIEYTVDVANTGQDPAINAVITDPIPTWTTFVPGSMEVVTGPNTGTRTDAANDDQAEFTGSAVRFRVGTGATTTAGGTIPNQTGATPAFTSVRFRVKLAANAPDGVSITNTASVDYAGFTLKTASVAPSTAVATPISNTADLSITKDDGVTTVAPGRSITYTIVVRNASSTTTVRGATIDDPLPSVLTGATWTCSATSGSACGAVSGSGSLSTTADLAPGGTVTYRVTADVVGTATGSLVNKVSVTPPGGVTDPNTSNNAASDTDTIVPTGDLRITKSNGTTNVSPGDSTTWTVTATNGGPATAVGATISDPLPASIRSATWTCVATGGAKCPAASGSGSIKESVTLPSGGTVTFTVIATTDSTATGTLANTAQIFAPSGFTDPDTSNNTSTDTDALGPSADLAVSKTHTPDPIVPGQPVTWTVSVDNRGPSVAPTAQVVDSMPAGVTATAVSSSTWDCEIRAGGTEVRCDVRDLKPGTTTIEITSDTDPSLTASVTNTAQVTSPSDTNTANDTASDTARVTPKVGLSIVKSHVPATLLAGTDATWYIQIRNEGPSAAENVEVTDALPAGVTLSSFTGPSGWSCSALRCTIASMPAGTSTFTLVGRVGASVAAGTLTNTATITSDTPDDTSDNTAQDEATVVAEADLAIQKSRVGALVAGNPITYTLVATNNGPANATSARVTDTLPVEITSATWTCAASGGATCGAATGSGTVNELVNLPTGGRVTFTISGVAAAGASGSIVNTATVTAPGGITDPNSANNQAIDTSNVAVRTALSIAKTDNRANAIPGTSIEWEIVVRNAGPSTATSAAVTDALPSGTTNATWTCTASAGSTCADSNGNGSIASAVTLAPSGSATYRVTATIDPNLAPGATLTNTAKVSAPSGALDPDPADNEATDTDTVTPVADLSITKTDATATATPGTSHRYTITVRNAGPSAASGVGVTDTLPTSLADATWSCTASSGSACGSATGTGSLATTADLAAGGTATYVIDSTIRPGARGTLTNSAQLTVPPGVTDPTTLDGSASDSTTLTPIADLRVTKTAAPSTGVPGEEIVYTITVENDGPSSAVGVGVKDALPMGIDSATWTCSAPAPSSCADASGTGAIPSSVDLAPNGKAVYTVRAHIDPSATGTVTNSVSIKPPADVSDPNPGDLDATVSTPLTPRVDVSVTKSGPATIGAGGTIEWTVTVTNTGPSTAAGTTVVDSIAPGVLNPSWTCAASAGSTCAAASSVGGIATTVDLAPNGTATFNVTGTVDPAMTQRSLSNTATVSAGPGITDTNPGNETASTTTAVERVADLAITKTSPPTDVVPGETITYTITVSNTGPATVAGVSVKDALPASLHNASWSCAASAGSACATGGGTGDLDTTVDLVAAGTATFTLIATLDPWFASTADASVSNTATVTAPNGVTDAAGNNSATETDRATPLADISVSKSDASPTVVAGGKTTYQITISNRGPSAVSNVAVADPLAAPFIASGATWRCQTLQDPPSSCAATSGTGALNTTVSLAPNDVATITLTVPVAADATGTIANTATVTPDPRVTDPTPGDHAATDTDTVLVQPNLRITKTDGTTTAIPGGGVAYTIVVANSGPSDAVGAPVADTLPAALNGATWTCTASGGGRCADATGTGSIASTVDLPVGATATYLLAATVDPAATGSLTNSASISAPTGATDPSPSDNTAQDVDTLVPTADVTVTKTDAAATHIPGTPVTYVITASNAGPSNAPGVRVQDAVAAPLRNATWTCTVAASSKAPAVACPTASGSGDIDELVDLPVGAIATFRLTADADESATGQAVNTAQVIMPAGVVDPNPADNSATDTDLLTPAAELRVTKTHDPATLVPGTGATYTIVVANDGPSAAPGVAITDALPTALTGATWTCTGANSATCSAASGTGSPGLQANLPKGSSVTLTVRATVRATATGSLTNTVSARLPATVIDPTPASGPGEQPGTTRAADTTTLVPTADVSITKTDGSPTARPGDPIDYTITVANDGPSFAPGVNVSDAIPSALVGATWTCAAGPGSTCSDTSGVASIDSNVDVAPGSSVTFHVFATINPAATGTLANSASVRLPSGLVDPDSSDHLASDMNTLVPTADLSVAKSHTPATLVPGQPVTYTITVANAGPSKVVGAQIDDALPPLLTNARWTCVASPGAACTDASGTGSISTTADLAPSSTVTYTVVAVVDPSATGSVSNTAVATLPAGTVDPTPATVPGSPTGSTAATDTAPLSPTAELSIEKSHSPTALIPGEPVTYTVIVRNAGPSFAPGVGVNDTLPASLLNATWTCTAGAGSSCTAASGSGSLATSVDLAPNGTATYVVGARIDPNATGSLANTATLTVPSGITDPTTSDHSARDADDVVPTADLRIAKRHSPPVLTPGQPVTYTIDVTNAGPSAAPGARVLDTIPAAIQGATWTCSPASACAATSGSGDIDTTVSLQPSASAQLVVTGTVDPASTGVAMNTAAVFPPAGVTDPIPSDDIADDSATLDPTADVAITKSISPTTPVPGTPVTYTITARNDGPSHAPGVRVIDPLSTSLLNATWTCSASGSATCGQADGTGSPDVQVNLAAGASATITVRADVDPDARGLLRNGAAALLPSGITDPDLSDNRAGVDVELVPTADVSITKTHAPDPIVPGTRITYTVVARNEGPSSARGVTVTDTLPAALQGAVWTCSPTPGSWCQAPTGTGDVAANVDLLADGTATFTISAIVDPASNGKLTNTATALLPAGLTDPDAGDRIAVDGAVLSPTAALSITKSDNATSVVPGADTTWSIVVTNGGPSTAVDVRISDPMPASLRSMAWTCGDLLTSGATCRDASGSGDVDTLATLPPGSSVTLLVQGVIRADVTGSLRNDATVAPAAGTTDPDPIDNAARDIDRLTPLADLRVSKSDGLASTAPGAPLTWTIVVTNDGPSDAPAARVTDAMPSAVTQSAWTCSSCTPSAGSGDVDTTAAIPVGASVTVTVDATISPSATGALVNTASAVPGAGVTDPDLTDNDGSDADVLAPGSSLEITKRHVGDVVAGQRVEWIIEVTNGGPSTASGARVFDALPTTVSGATWTCRNVTPSVAGSKCNTPSGNGSIDTTVDLPPLAKVSFTVSGTLASSATGTLENTATVTPPTGVVDVDPSKLRATDVASIGLVADVSVRKVRETQAVAGEVVDYLIVMTNAGPSDVVGARLIDDLPQTPVGAVWTCKGIDGARCGLAAGIDTPRISVPVDVPVGGRVELRVRMVAPVGGTTVVNTGRVELPAGVRDPSTTNNVSTDSTDLLHVVLPPSETTTTTPTTPTPPITEASPSTAAPFAVTSSVATSSVGTPTSPAATSPAAQTSPAAADSVKSSRAPVTTIRKVNRRGIVEDGPGSLSLTGSEAGGLALFALLLVASGVGLVAVARRRRRA